MRGTYHRKTQPWFVFKSEISGAEATAVGDEDRGGDCSIVCGATSPFSSSSTTSPYSAALYYYLAYCRRLDHQLLSASAAPAAVPAVTDTITTTTAAAGAPKPSPDGTAVCHVCQQTFFDNLVLKEHVEKVHPREMYRCTVPGCDKIFSTRKSRNRHSQNDNLHYLYPVYSSFNSTSSNKI